MHVKRQCYVTFRPFLIYRPIYRLLIDSLKTFLQINLIRANIYTVYSSFKFQYNLKKKWWSWLAFVLKKPYYYNIHSYST